MMIYNTKTVLRALCIALTLCTVLPAHTFTLPTFNRPAQRLRSVDDLDYLGFDNAACTKRDKIKTAALCTAAGCGILCVWRYFKTNSDEKARAQELDKKETALQKAVAEIAQLKHQRERLERLNQEERDRRIAAEESARQARQERARENDADNAVNEQEGPQQAQQYFHPLNGDVLIQHVNVIHNAVQVNAPHTRQRIIQMAQTHPSASGAMVTGAAYLVYACAGPYLLSAMAGGALLGEMIRRYQRWGAHSAHAQAEAHNPHAAHENNAVALVAHGGQDGAADGAIAPLAIGSALGNAHGPLEPVQGSRGSWFSLPAWLRWR